MLKCIGLLGLVISTGMIGVNKARNLKIRIVLLEDFLQMIIELKGQINYFKEPLPDIFDKITKTDDLKSFNVLKEISSVIHKKGSEIVKIWPETIDLIYKSEPLTAEDIDIFKYPANFIGQTDFKNHIYHFTYLEEKLHKQISDACDDLKTKGPMYNKIGFFLGSIGALLLI